jgi:hypothetical protein
MISILYLLFGAGHYIDRGAFWTGVGVVVAAIGLWLAFIQLQGIKKVSRADFAKRFIDTFFTHETRTLFSLLLNSALEFAVLEIKDESHNVIDRLPYLKINKQIAGQVNGIVMFDDHRTGYSAFEVDDLLLGFFDDLGWYERKGLIDLETIKQAFGYYICESHDSKVMKKYLADEDNRGRYADFDYIYKKVKNSSAW